MARPFTTAAAATDGVVVNRPCRIVAITLFPGTTAAVVTLYDNASAASGTVLDVLSAPANGPNDFHSWPVKNPLIAKNGVWADYDGASAEVYVYVA